MRKKKEKSKDNCDYRRHSEGMRDRGTAPHEFGSGMTFAELLLLLSTFDSDRFVPSKWPLTLRPSI